MKTKEEIFEEYNEYQTENDYVNSEEELKDYINIAIDNIKYQKEDLFKEVKANKRMKRLSALKNFFLGAFQLYGTDLYNKDNEIIKEILIFINYFQEMYLRISQTVTADNYQEMLKLTDFITIYYNEGIDYFESKRDTLEFACQGKSYEDYRYQNNIEPLSEFFSAFITQEAEKNVEKVKKI